MEIAKNKVFNAEVNELQNVQSFVIETLSDLHLEMKLQNQLNIVIEELFVNIANYAYENGGEVEIKVETKMNEISITFIDSGMKFNPLEIDDPNIDAKAEERRIGGLGIFMVKNMMDDIKYKFENNQNILTIVKKY